MQANPAKFELGGVYLGDLSPSLEVEKLDRSSALLAEAFGIVIEIVDDLKVAEALYDKGELSLHPTEEQLKSVQAESTVRYVLKPKYARHLCYNLLDTLAEGGDRVAAKLLEALEEIRKERETES